MRYVQGRFQGKSQPRFDAAIYRARWSIPHPAASSGVPWLFPMALKEEPFLTNGVIPPIKFFSAIYQVEGSLI